MGRRSWPTPSRLEIPSSSAVEDDDQLILDEVGVIIRDKDGGILQKEGLGGKSADHNVSRKALKSGQAPMIRVCAWEIMTTTSSPCRWTHRTAPTG